MHGSIRNRLAAGTAFVALVAAAPAAAQEYQPFVTDFPQGVAPVEPYEPFVTDFGKTSIGDQTPTYSPAAEPTAAPRASAPSGGLDWPSLGVGIAGGLGLAAVLGGAVAFGRRQRAATA